MQELRDARAKTLGSCRVTGSTRATHVSEFGLMNEPEFTQPTAGEFGLCLDDEPSPDFGEGCGRSSGVTGCAVPESNFDQPRAKLERHQVLHGSGLLLGQHSCVRTRRDGLRVLPHQFHPNYPPDDPESPAYRNLSATIDAHFWFGRIFASTSRRTASGIWSTRAAGHGGYVVHPTDHINNRGRGCDLRLTDFDVAIDSTRKRWPAGAGVAE